MDAERLAAWLETDESWSVGSRAYGEESVGHAAGRELVGILGRGRDELDEREWRLVRKAVGVIRRHRAQWPDGDVEHSRWRWALMNWGHDPLEDPDGTSRPAGPSQ